MAYIGGTILFIGRKEGLARSATVYPLFFFFFFFYVFKMKREENDCFLDFQKVFTTFTRASVTCLKQWHFLLNIWIFFNTTLYLSHER